MRTCVTPHKTFIYGVHKPAYIVDNLRPETHIENLGHLPSGNPYTNQINFPKESVRVDNADWIFEIPNPLPFRGSTYIDKEWADASADNPERISLPDKPDLSLSKILENEQIPAALLDKLPVPLLLSLATCSTDPKDLIRLAELSCHLEKDDHDIPTGLSYNEDEKGRIRARIKDHALFEAVANNPALPDAYKKVMVLRPGAQGGSEIIGEYRDEEKSHVFEYLRRNSYIAGGHYAANMADDAVRYSIGQLSEHDMEGLRHLYYQRTYIRLANALKLDRPASQQTFSVNELEVLRKQIRDTISAGSTLKFTATLWGWNFGFDYAPTGYRLHASHQQIHQQYAMLPEEVTTVSGYPHNSCGSMPAFGCGDMIAEVIQDYRKATGNNFFTDYLTCIRNNRRMDNRSDLESSLIVWEDEHVILFVPKAQTSQWELQLMALTNQHGEVVGNILEADTPTRASLNKGIYLAQCALAGRGARMVTSIEYPKRLGAKGEKGQHLLYCFLPRLPESPGAFSEAQLRYINGHYPEDFAAVCRQQIENSRISNRKC